jgi:Ca2+ transporting ATPase
MDSLASLALATEPPKDDLLNKPPHGKDEYIISRKMIKHIIAMAIY